MKLFTSTIAIVLMLVTSAVQAQSSITIATGSPTGTYSGFFKSLQAVCGNNLQLVEKASTGSDANLDLLINKQADIAFVQTDTLQFMAINDPRVNESQMRVLATMYPEEVHVVARKTLAKTSGGFSIGSTNLFGNKVALNSLSDLAGHKVGAWGGSFTTARAISFLGGIRYDTVQFQDAKTAQAALDNGAISAIIAVGGQPLGFVKGLSSAYKLLKVDAGLADKVKAYTKTRVIYQNLAPDSVETVAARSVLLTRNYTTADRKSKIQALGKCISDNLMEFVEGTGHHPKWSDVDLGAPVNWAMYGTK